MLRRALGLGSGGGAAGLGPALLQLSWDAPAALLAHGYATHAREQPLAAVSLPALRCFSAAAAARPPRRAAAAAAPPRHARSFRAPSLPAAALGVVEQLHDDVTVAVPSGASRSFWEVLEFRPDATVLETWKTPEVLGLHPRDVHLFTSDTGLGQRAMIAPRSGAILFRTEVARAVVYADRAVLFPAARLQDTVRVAQGLKNALRQRSALPFELKVLESLLAETARTFDTKCKRMGMVAETVSGPAPACVPRWLHNRVVRLPRFRTLHQGSGFTLHVPVPELNPSLALAR
jgi:hypothetical protein